MGLLHKGQEQPVGPHAGSCTKQSPQHFSKPHGCLSNLLLSGIFLNSLFPLCGQFHLLPSISLTHHRGPPRASSLRTHNATRALSRLSPAIKKGRGRGREGCCALGERTHARNYVSARSHSYADALLHTGISRDEQPPPCRTGIQRAWDLDADQGE